MTPAWRLRFAVLTVQAVAVIAIAVVPLGWVIQIFALNVAMVVGILVGLWVDLSEEIGLLGATDDGPQ